MTADSINGSHPGLSVGPTSEFSLFFRVKPGEGEALRAALRDLQDTPGYRPGDYGMAIQTIHEARFVLFDDDTRLAFMTSFDGPWDAYMEDFFTSGPTLALFDAIFRHTEGYDGLPDLAAVQAFILGAEQTAAAYARNYGGTVKEIQKAQRVNAAFQQVLDHPQAAEALAAPGAAAAAGRGLRLGRDGRARQAPMSDHISGPRALADPIADITDLYAFPSPSQPQTPRAGDEHVAVRAAVRPVLRRADLPLPAATPDPIDAERRPGAVRGRRGTNSSSTASSPIRRRRGCAPAGAGGHLHHQYGRIGHLPGRRPGRRFRARDPRLRRRALGPVHHGRPRGVEDDRDPEAGVHRPGRDLSRRQERAEPRGRDRHRCSSAGARWSAWSPRRSPGDGSTSGSNASGGRR